MIDFLVGFFCLLGGPISNRIGLSYTLLLGAVGYPIYSYVLKAEMARVMIKPLKLNFKFRAGLYTNNRYVGSHNLPFGIPMQLTLSGRAMYGLSWSELQPVEFRKFALPMLTLSAPKGS